MAQAAASADPNVQALAQCSARADNLISRMAEAPTFNETGGAKAYAMWRPRFVDFVGGAGPDFEAALTFNADIVAQNAYTPTQVNATDATGAPAWHMPQIRQRAMLLVL